MATIVQSKTLDIIVNGFKFQAKTWGDIHNKPMLAIHGWLDNANSFDKIAPSLSENYYIVAIDLAGHGLSDHREENGNYYIWDYAIDMLNCIDQLKWKKCTIIAHSLGTGIASIIAGAFPEKVEKLIFIDGIGAPFVSEEDTIAFNFKRTYKQLKIAKKTKLHGFSDKEIATYQSRDAAIKARVNNVISDISYKAAEILVDRVLKTTTNGYGLSHDPKITFPAYYRITEQQAKHFIKHIESETLIVLGKQGLFAKGLFNSRLETFKMATIQWIDGNHHMHLEEAYKETLILINQFLKTTTNYEK